MRPFERSRNAWNRRGELVGTPTGNILELSCENGADGGRRRCARCSSIAIW
jgi:hypothetical protein